MRLDSAHRLLTDQRFDNVSSSEIAARCGSVEPSHFAKRFRRAFSLGPTEFRCALARHDCAGRLRVLHARRPGRPLVHEGIDH